MVMRYSLKLPLLVMSLVAIFFGSRSLIDHRYQKLEESLIIFVADERLASLSDFEDDKYFLAKGVPGNLTWFNSDFAREKRLAQIEYGQPRQFDHVFYVGRIKWTSWSSVRLSYGIIYRGKYIRFFQEAKFAFTDGRWICVDNGVYDQVGGAPGFK